MKILKCPRINEEVQVGITQENCIAYHKCFDDEECPLDECFSKKSFSTSKNEVVLPSNLNQSFGDMG